MKNSKELEDIKKAITKWVDKHDKEVQFVGCFAAFKGDDFEVVDDLIVGYGLKRGIKISLEELNKMVKEDKEGFINW